MEWTRKFAECMAASSASRTSEMVHAASLLGEGEGTSLSCTGEKTSGSDEAELWAYTPLNGLDIKTRQTPELEGNRTSKRLRPGDTFQVIEKKKVGEVTFLRLSGGEGWLFDTKPNVGVMCKRVRRLRRERSRGDARLRPKGPPADLFGSVFLQEVDGEMEEGNLSFHFVSPGDCYISLSNVLDEFRSDDGSLPPDRKPFTDCAYDAGRRTFTAAVHWHPPVQGVVRWEFEMVFAEDFSIIESGKVDYYSGPTFLSFFGLAPAVKNETLQFGPEANISYVRQQDLEFRVVLDKTTGRKIGARVVDFHGDTLEITEVTGDLLQHWNDNHPELAVKRGDRIAEVNGMKKWWTQNEILQLVVKRRSQNNGNGGFPEHLRVVNHVGSGSYGDVYMCKDTRSGNRVAVKHVKDAPSQGKVALREIRCLAHLRHENLLHLLDLSAMHAKSFTDMFLVLPYLPMDLDRVLHESTWNLGDRQARVIVSQILRACGHLHAADVAHRDLKPANVLLSNDFKVKVCDFGLARCGLAFNAEVDKREQSHRSGGDRHPGHLTENVVTRQYRAPEVMLLPKHYTSAIDIWSIGCILGEILLRKVMFEGKGPVELISSMAKVLGTPTENDLEWLPKDSDAFRFVKLACPRVRKRSLATLLNGNPSASVDLMRGLLCWHPGQRLTAAQAQEHEYIRYHLPKEKEASTPPKPFDWSFDDYQPTYENIRERLYMEHASYHPEILKRQSSLSSPASQQSSVSAVQPKRQRRLLALPAMVSRGLFKKAACTFASFLA